MEKITTQTIDLSEYVKQRFTRVNNNWSMKRKNKVRKLQRMRRRNVRSVILSTMKEILHDTIRAEHSTNSN